MSDYSSFFCVSPIATSSMNIYFIREDYAVKCDQHQKSNSVFFLREGSESCNDAPDFDFLCIFGGMFLANNHSDS